MDKIAEQLPVFQFLPEISDALKKYKGVLISAAPGAGKTMLIPELLSQVAGNGQILLVEPRRIAARAAAMGIAAIHGLVPGKDCGYAVRGEKCGDDNCRIMARICSKDLSIRLTSSTFTPAPLAIRFLRDA